MDKNKRDIAEYYQWCDKSYQHWGQTSQNEVYEIHYGFYDKNHKTHKRSLMRMNEVISSKLNPQKKWNILDAGCGVGASSIYLAKNHDVTVTGITVSKYQVKKAKKFAKKYGIKRKVQFKIQNFENTNFKPETFNGVFGLESICYASDKKDFINEAYRLLKPGGHFVCADFFAIKKNLNPTEKYAMDNWLNGWVMPNIALKDYFQKSMKNAGFKNIQIADITKNILPSAKEIYRRGKEGYPEDIFENRSPKQLEHVKANMFQYITLKMRLWKYLIFYGEK